MEESTNGLPDVQGLAAIVSDDQDKAPVAPPQDQQVQTPDNQGTGQQTPTDELNLAQFKTPEALLKGYKELQGAFTRTSQEKAALNQQVTQMQAQFQEQMELMRLSQMRQPVRQTAPQKDFDQMFIENPQQAVQALAAQQASTMLLQSKVQDVLEEESLKNPQEFQERYAYAKMVSQQYPNLVSSRAGVTKLFQLGDKVRAEQQKAQAYKAVTAVFGEDVDFEKFRQLIKRDGAGQNNNPNNAYMPDSSISNRNQSESAPINVETEINDAVKKGDPDAVIAALFKRQGLR